MHAQLDPQLVVDLTAESQEPVPIEAAPTEDDMIDVVQAMLDLADRADVIDDLVELGAIAMAADSL